MVVPKEDGGGMKRCKYKGCISYALNDHPDSGLCDKCWWRTRAEKMETALRVIHTWATFDNGSTLESKYVVGFCVKALKV